MSVKTDVRVLAGSVLVSLLNIACQSNNAADQKAPPPVPVAAYRVNTGNATYYDVYPATVTALNQVDLRPEVSGYITDIYFKEGQHIRKGMSLYAIDQRLYQAAYDQAVANLNVAKSNVTKVQQDVDRYTDLAKKDAVARQTVEHAQADLQSAKMQVAAGEASVKTAETNLHYSVIHAPFDGTIGISQVRVGSSVSAGQTLLNTVSSDNPMAVDCAVDQKLIGGFSQLLERKPEANDSTFTISLPDQSVYPMPGSLSLMDRAVDPQTGTIRVRLVFPNPHSMLKPGLNCNLRVRTTGSSRSLLIPYKAVIEQMGEYSVYVVNGNKAVHRRVSLGMPIKDSVIVKSGLQPGELVVTEGVQKLKENAIVMVTQDGSQKPAAAPQANAHQDTR